MKPLLKMMLARLQRPAGDDGSDTGGTGSGGAADDGGGGTDSIDDLSSLVAGGDADDDNSDADDGQGADDDDQGLLPHPDDDDSGADGAKADADDPEEQWEVNGQQFKVKKSELRAGYMKDVDYRHKTAKVADKERAVDQFANHVQQERLATANRLDVFMQALQQDLIGSQPDARLIDSEPQEYMRQQERHTARLQKLQQAMGERQALGQQMVAQQQQQTRQRHVREAEALAEAVPEWRNEKVRAKDLQEIGNSLVARGFSADEVTNTIDHRLVLLARDAAKYHKLMEVRSKQQKPPPPRPVRPGAAGQSNPNSITQRAKQRLARNSNDVDALAGLLGASGF